MNNTRSRILLDQLTGGQLDWAPMDDQFDEVSLFVISTEAVDGSPHRLKRKIVLFLFVWYCSVGLGLFSKSLYNFEKVCDR